MSPCASTSVAEWVDWHCHLDLFPDHVALIAECDRERVSTLTVTTTPKAWQRNRDLAATSSCVRVALGLHPQLVAERLEELPLFERFLPEARFVGEIGLDAGPRFYGSFAAQQRVFDRILSACSEQGGKILSVHSARAAAKTLASIERHLPPDRGRVVLHWFTGSATEAKRAVRLGCYFSINREMLESDRHRGLVTTLPINRVLTETDGPFVPYDGRPSRPKDVAATVDRLAALLRVPRDELARRILANLAELTHA